MSKIMQGAGQVGALFRMMKVRHWPRLLFYLIGRASVLAFGWFPCEHIILPFKALNVCAHTRRPSGLKFLVEIASQHAYAHVTVPATTTPLVLYDVGANCGFFSILLCKQHAHLKAYCFEPHPETFATLVKNIAINELQTRLIPLNCAAGAEPGELPINISAGSSMAQMGSAAQGSDLTQVHLVSVVTLDAMAQQYEAPAVVKIDVEGHEVAVLLGARRILPQVVSIVLEYHSPELKRKCHEALIDSGFSVQECGDLLYGVRV